MTIYFAKKKKTVVFVNQSLEGHSRRTTSTLPQKIEKRILLPVIEICSFFKNRLLVFIFALADFVLKNLFN